jgi:hypothetical protein
MKDKEPSESKFDKYLWPIVFVVIASVLGIPAFICSYYVSSVDTRLAKIETSVSAKDDKIEANAKKIETITFWQGRIDQRFAYRDRYKLWNTDQVDNKGDYPEPTTMFIDTALLPKEIFMASLKIKR